VSDPLAAAPPAAGSVNPVPADDCLNVISVINIVTWNNIK